MASRRVRQHRISQLFAKIFGFIRRCIFQILSVGPLPKHVAFIMDGNRRYARKKNLPAMDGYRIGFFSLMSIIKYCYELGVTYITLYAFSIDNFKRRPEEVQFLMEMMQEKIEGLLEDESIAHKFGARVIFVGNLNLLSEKLRITAQKAMEATAKNTKTVLQICVAYTAIDEIVHAVEQSCHDKWDETRFKEEIAVETEERNKQEVLPLIRLTDIERKLYMSVAPDPDILIRTSGETRLSNFILWQTQTCLLYSPISLWPELGLRHLVWAVLNFQRHFHYFEKKKQS